jgi:bifunctional non-homologous end joining protein LigD
VALKVYRAKRRFGVTAEPRGRKARTQGRAFVIQKHDATRLHYDLRLELDGVMKSWAVTRGPSMVPGDKRLSIHVEDHPIEYNAFEGTIPKGEYGGGTVMIWDRGEWIPEGDPQAGYKKGHLDFRLEGEKLQGAWHLVRMRKREGERQDPWLLIKSEDEAARSKKDPDILEEKTKSAVSGRTMEQIATGKGGKAVWSSARKKQVAASPPAKQLRTTRQPKARTAAKRTRAVAKKSPRASASKGTDLEGRPAPLPDFVPPCLALLSATAPEGANWLHEIKFDGYRTQAHIEAGKVQLNTRNGLDWTKRFQPVAEAFKALPVENAIVDGEIVIETAEGLSSFSALQEALKKGKGDFVFYAFDLLHLNGKDVRRAPLAARKAVLESLLADAPKDGAIKFSENFEADGAVLLAHACRMHLEGVISKRRDAPYRSGRGGDWIKTKCGERQEFVIIGFAPATNDVRAVGALVVGYYQNKILQYAGRVGTGYTVAVARELWKKLRPLHADKTPLDKMPVEERGRGAQWVEPKLVAEVDFRGWTHGTRLRHPSFKGLREDKAATEVVRESKDMPTAATSKPPVANTSRGRKPVSARKPATAKRAGDEEPSVGLTHPDRVYWEDVGLTKQGLADYYTQAWDWIAPHVTGRVLSLVRCPDGAAGKCFFQKHASGGLGEKHLRLVPEEDGKVIGIDNLDGLIALVQAGVLEVHVRGSTIDRLDAANRIVFDLDPGPEVGWPEVKQAARAVRERLDALGITSFLKTTGGKGLHVVMPVNDAPWDAVKAFAKSFALAMVKDSPDRYVAVAAKRERTGRIFIDYLRNSREATAICAYSTRARAGATVSVPIAWSELAALTTPNRYTVGNVMGRLTKLKADPWADIGRVKQKLPALKKK